MSLGEAACGGPTIPAAGRGLGRVLAGVAAKFREEPGAVSAPLSRSDHEEKAVR